MTPKGTITVKLEHPAETPETVETAQKILPDRKRPVLVYIMVLFIAAFLLMAFSFLMHQRSNEQVLGELHTSVNLLEDYQQALEANNRLTGQVADLEKELSAAKSDTTKQETEKNTLKTQLDAAKQEISALQQQIAALEALAKAQTLYRNGGRNSNVIVAIGLPTTGDISGKNQRIGDEVGAFVQENLNFTAIAGAMITAFDGFFDLGEGNGGFRSADSGACSIGRYVDFDRFHKVTSVLYFDGSDLCSFYFISSKGLVSNRRDL